MIKKMVCKKMFAIFLLGFGSMYSQDEINKIVVPDSLLEKNYKELHTEYRKHMSKNDSALIYADAYLKKAKIEKDTFRITVGYHLFSSHFYNEKSFVYNDSVIQITKDKNYKFHPLSAYVINGNLYFNRKNFSKSFDNYMNAKRYVENSRMPADNNHYINHQIGGIKAKLLFKEEALKICQQSWKFVNKHDYKNKNKPEYIQVLTDLSLTYAINKKLDSASFYNKMGIKEALKLKSERHYNLLVLNEGVCLYHKKKNNKALDSLWKAVKYFEKSKNYNPMTQGYYYMGMVYKSTNDFDNTIKYFKKIDSIFEISNYIDPQVRESYEVLINYYKSKNDKENTLLYIERLMKVDSIFNSNFKNLTPKIIKEYDTPKLLKEKDEVINSVSKKNKNYINIGVLMIGFIISIGAALIYNIQKQRKLKVRFNKLLESSESRVTYLKKKPDVKTLNKSVNFNVSDEVLQKIKIEVDGFEKNHGYLEQGITINSVAKKMETNSKYLSLFINNYKDQTFTSYINKLRIEYAIKRLKNDLTFRKFTVKAIANEVGFNSAESFLTAFYKETQLKPSYFLRNIEILDLSI